MADGGGDVLGGLGGTGLVTGTIGAGIGAVGGYLAAQARDEASRDLRRQIRQGIGQAQADTVRQLAGFMGTSEFQTADNFIRSLYGMGPSSGAERYNQLLGMYGGNAGQLGLEAGAFGYGLKGYGGQADVNKAYVQQMLGVMPTANMQGVPLTGPGPGGVLGAYANQYGAMANQYGRAAATGFAGMGQGMIGLTPREAGAAAQNVGALQSAQAGLAQGAGYFNAANPLYQNYNQFLSQTLAARGLGQGLGAASTVAGGLAGRATELQLQQIPTLLQLGAAPYTYAEKFGQFGGNAMRDVQAATGGVGVYGGANMAAQDFGPNAGLIGALQGAAAGFSGGAAVGVAGQGQADYYKRGRQVVGYSDTGGYRSPVYGSYG